MSSKSFHPGTHILLDLYGGLHLRDASGIAAALHDAAKAAGATVLSCDVHGFGGAGGVTGVALLAESHISIHTWPEHGYAAVDVFMCGSAKPQRAVDHLIACLAPERWEQSSIPRGQRNHASQPSR